MEIPGSLCKKVKLSNNAQNWVSGSRRPEREERGRLWEPRAAGCILREPGAGTRAAAVAASEGESRPGAVP